MSEMRDQPIAVTLDFVTNKVLGGNAASLEFRAIVNGVILFENIARYDKLSDENLAELGAAVGETLTELDALSESSRSSSTVLNKESMIIESVDYATFVAIERKVFIDLASRLVALGESKV